MKNFLYSVVLTFVFIIIWSALAHALFAITTLGHPYFTFINLHFAQRLHIPFSIIIFDCDDVYCGKVFNVLGALYSVISWIILFVGLHMFKKMPIYLKIPFIVFVIAVPVIAAFYNPFVFTGLLPPPPGFY